VSFARGWPIVLSAMFGIALGLSPMPFYTIGIFAPMLAHEFHWTFAQIFRRHHLHDRGRDHRQPVGGLASDRFGVRPWR
jgi:hypothetical protein